MLKSNYYQALQVLSLYIQQSPSIFLYSVYNDPQIEFVINENHYVSNFNILMEQKLIQQLSCSVCLSLFKKPLTLECGHTFCKFCILNIGNKKSCPICRANILNFSENHAQDKTISDLIKYLKLKQSGQSKQAEKTQKKQKNQHLERLLLLDIKTEQLLLPSTKVMATFQLQSPTLLSHLERFVSRQQSPFNTLGVVSKILFMNQLRYNVYQCVIEGICFCQVNKEETNKSEEENEQYFFRMCEARVIYQEQDIKSGVLERFIEKFLKIKDKKTLEKIYKCIDPDKLFSKANSHSMYYSILRIMAGNDLKKYEVATSFNNCEKQKFLEQFLNNLPSDIVKYPNHFIKIEKEKGLEKIIFFFILVAAFLLFFIPNYVILNEEN